MLDMFDKVLEITGVGSFPIYRIWRKRPIREDVRMYGTDQTVPKLLWPERPRRERRCIGWVCGKKVPANRLVCPWCGSWNGEREWRMQPLEFPAASIEVQIPQSRAKELLKEILGDS